MIGKMVNTTCNRRYVSDCFIGGCETLVHEQRENDECMKDCGRQRVKG